MTETLFGIGAGIALLVAVWLDLRRDKQRVDRERYFASRRVWRRALEDGNWRRP